MKMKHNCKCREEIMISPGIDYKERTDWPYGKCLFYVGENGTEKNPDAEFVDGAWRFKADWAKELIDENSHLA